MDSSIQPGDLVLGKYRVERVLGQGGMGVVLAARHVELGELFAIKVLLPQAVEAPGAVDRFVREARSAARLRSEHVTKVVDAGRLPDGAPYMVMEHLVGSDLAAVLRARGALPIEEAIDYVLQACEAISEAHAARIVHRDLKPGNLFLTRRSNGRPCVKVLDFGISKRVDSSEQELTQTGMVLGSPLYMAPEQIRRAKVADPRSDVWAMGVVLYRLATGALPFRGEGVAEIIASVLQDAPRPATAVRPELPRGLDGVLGRALQKEPDRRFQSIDELVAALHALLREAGVTAVTATMPNDERASRPALDPVPTLDGTTAEAARTQRQALQKRRTTAVVATIAGVGIAAAVTMLGVWLGSPRLASPGDGEGIAGTDLAASSALATSAPPMLLSSPSSVVVPEVAHTTATLAPSMAQAAAPPVKTASPGAKKSAAAVPSASPSSSAAAPVRPSPSANAKVKPTPVNRTMY